MMTPWLKPCMHMWECGMCLDLTFPVYLQVLRDLLFVTISPPYLWQVGPILFGCGISHLGWSSLIYWRDLTFHGLYSPHITHTQTYSHTREKAFMSLSALVVPLLLLAAGVGFLLFFFDGENVSLMKYNQYRITQARDEQVEVKQDQSMKGCSQKRVGQ